jgi:hypothetical protein
MPVYDSATGARRTKTTSPRRKVHASITRPADTTAYAAGDAVSNSTSAPTAISAADVVDVNGGSGRIVEIALETNNATVTNGTFRVYVFNTSFTPNNDNAASDKVHANRAYLQGYADLPLLTADGASAGSAVTRVNESVAGGDDGVPMHFVCASGDNDLYIVLVATGAYTPASGQVFDIALTIEPD